MLAVAEREVPDSRVPWVRSRAESLSDVVEAGRADAVVCNSAIWQSDLAATLNAVKRVLRPGGRLVFNLGQQFVRLPDGPAEAQQKPGLVMVALAYAILDHDLVLRPPSPSRKEWTTEELELLLENSGLSIRSTEILEYDQPLQQVRDWLMVPVFGEQWFAPLTAEQRADVLAKAYRKVQGSTPTPQRWYVVVATS